MASTVASQQEGSGFKPTGQLGPFCVEFACSPRACVGFLPVLPPTIQIRLIGDSKLSVGVNVKTFTVLNYEAFEPWRGRQFACFAMKQEVVVT